MSSLPTHDLLRAEVDVLHARLFFQCDNFVSAHKRFFKAVKDSFSPLTEFSALSYANAKYHADIENIEQYFNVEKTGWQYELVLITSQKRAKYVTKKQVHHSYKCLNEALEIMRVLNVLFDFDFCDEAND